MGLVVGFGEVVMGNFLHFPHTVSEGDADAFHFTVNQHFARAALADAAVHAALAALQAVAVDGESCLVQGGRDGVALRSLDLLTLVFKGRDIPFGDIQNGMM